jgi:hypothetical protein
MKRDTDLRSHLIPRTRAGRIAVVLFLALFALTQPPAVYLFANRMQPWILGLPFLYAYLLVLYLLLIAVLLWAKRRNL